MSPLKKQLICQDKQSRLIKIQQIRSGSPQHKYPSLAMHRTQSQVSYQGNTIDMVRIVRKNQQSRRSRINICRKQYQQFQRPSIQKQNQRYSDPQDYYDKDDWQNINNYFNEDSKSIKALEDKQMIQRTSSYFLIDPKSQQSSVKQFAILIIFFCLVTSQILVASYLFNVGQLFQQNQYLMPFFHDYKIIWEFEQYHFLSLLIMYLTAQCLYHAVVMFIDSKTNNKYKLIDQQTSKLNYILRGRQIRQPDGVVYKFMKSPYFTLIVIILSIALYSYGICQLLYYNQINLNYDTLITLDLYLLIEILYFTLILPETIRYIFFQKMYINANLPTQTLLSQDSNLASLIETKFYTYQNWWSKVCALFIGISIFYSLFISSPWLIIVSFAKIQINFKRNKYKIDTFFVQFGLKALMLLICFVIMSFRSYYDSEIGISIFNQIVYIIILTTFMLISRIYANVILKNMLYQYLFAQMHILIGLIIFIFMQVLFITKMLYYLQQIELKFILIAFYSIFLIVCIYYQGLSRQFVIFDDKNLRKSDVHIQMQNL